ncbi:MAG TPA: SDR family oxidoreductase [Acidimicrobiia bacterium]|nr:SDR family oxidoreductase [Acidimicrobiia bacterium]
MQPRVLLVTGGSRGIGAEVAYRASRSDWHVLLTYVQDQASARGVVDRIRSDGGSAGAIKCDVQDEAAIVGAFRAADAVGRLEGLVVSAGIVGPAARVDELDAERVMRILVVNTFGAIMCCREAVRRMSTRHGGTGGSIVLVSSAASRLGSPNEYVDYAASKGAIDTLGLGLAREVAGEGIRVNVVRPGIIDTQIHASGGQPGRVARLGPLTPMGRAGTVSEVAEGVLWFLGEDSSYCTGSILDVAGGR